MLDFINYILIKIVALITGLFMISAPISEPIPEPPLPVEIIQVVSESQPETKPELQPETKPEIKLKPLKPVLPKPIISEPNKKPIIPPPSFIPPEPKLIPVPITSPFPPSPQKDLLIRDIINFDTTLPFNSIDYWPVGSFKIQTEENLFIQRIEYQSDVPIQIKIDDKRIITCNDNFCVPTEQVSASETFIVRAKPIKSGKQSIWIKKIELISDKVVIYSVSGLPTDNPNFTFTISQ